MKDMSRFSEDWVQDTLLSPSFYTLSPTPSMFIEDVGQRFSIYGSYPKINSDWRWYKSLYGENKKFNESHQKSQIFHYSNDGKCSWYEFAKEINRLSGSECKINPIHSIEYPQDAVRPKQVVLNKRKIIDFFDLDLIFWKDSLKKCIQILSANSN